MDAEAKDGKKCRTRFPWLHCDKKSGRTEAPITTKQPEQGLQQGTCTQLGQDGMDKLVGRVALVSGAGAGIGAAITTELVKAGMKVVGLARRRERVEALAQQLEGSRGELHALKADMSKPSDIVDVFKYIEDHFGAVAVVVNNAGAMPVCSLQDMDNDTIKNLMDINVTGVAASCREAILNMKRHNTTDGHIININSTLGHEVPIPPMHRFGVYVASKHAVTALCKAVRSEIAALPGYDIKVTSISPGAVRTELVPPEVIQHMPDELREKMLHPVDVARAVVFALSSPPHVEVLELTLAPQGEVL